MAPAPESATPRSGTTPRNSQDRREFGPEKLPIYDAYCAIWASDDLAYHGGGATHGSAYALFQNRQMARLAKLLGVDDFAFRRPGPLPVRVDLKSGKLRVLEETSFVGKGGAVPGGAATVLDVKLDPARELDSLTVRAIANEVLVGLMGATLESP